jgi:ribosome-binding protein aMBF1 (putative translation factor)
MNRSNVAPPGDISADQQQSLPRAANVVEFVAPRQKPAKAPSPIDVHVGGRLQMKRLACGLSEHELATAAGLSVTHLRRLETGALRIDARIFRDLARILGEPPSFFFKKSPRECTTPRTSS